MLDMFLERFEGVGVARRMIVAFSIFRTASAKGVLETPLRSTGGGAVGHLSIYLRDTGVGVVPFELDRDLDVWCWYLLLRCCLGGWGWKDLLKEGWEMDLWWGSRFCLRS